MDTNPLEAFEAIFEMAAFIAPLALVVIGIIIIWRLNDIYTAQTMIYNKLKDIDDKTNQTPEK